MKFWFWLVISQIAVFFLYHYFFLQFVFTEHIRVLNSWSICFYSNPFFSNLSNCILSFYANLFLLIYILPCHSILISSLLPSNLSYSILFSSELYFFVFSRPYMLAMAPILLTEISHISSLLFTTVRENSQCTFTVLFLNHITK